MEDLGCVLVVVLMIAATIGIALAIASSNARGRAATEAAARERGEKIHKLLEYLPGTARRKEALSAVHTLLSGRALGYRPELTGKEQWFSRVAPILRGLVNDPDGASIPEWYFTCFSFTEGHQQELLAWLTDLLTASDIDLERLARVAERALASGGAREAEWFYRRTLEALPERKDNPKFRTFALQMGRLSYPFSRPGRKPTVYDEQAIANDIAVSL
jgi:hypothetical protein